MLIYHSPSVHLSRPQTRFDLKHTRILSVFQTLSVIKLYLLGILDLRLGCVLLQKRSMTSKWSDCSDINKRSTSWAILLKTEKDGTALSNERKAFLNQLGLLLHIFSFSFLSHTPSAFICSSSKSAQPGTVSEICGVSAEIQRIMIFIGLQFKQ